MASDQISLTLDHYATQILQLNSSVAGSSSAQPYTTSVFVGCNDQELDFIPACLQHVNAGDINLVDVSRSADRQEAERMTAATIGNVAEKCPEPTGFPLDRAVTFLPGRTPMFRPTIEAGRKVKDVHFWYVFTLLVCTLEVLCNQPSNFLWMPKYSTRDSTCYMPLKHDARGARRYVGLDCNPIATPCQSVWPYGMVTIKDLWWSFSNLATVPTIKLLFTLAMKRARPGANQLKEHNAYLTQIFFVTIVDDIFRVPSLACECVHV